MRIVQRTLRRPGLPLILATLPVSAIAGATHEAWPILYVGAPIALIGMVTLLWTIRLDAPREVHDENPSVLPQPAEP